MSKYEYWPKRSYENVKQEEAMQAVISTLHLVKWAYEIALGMEYLSQKKVF